MLQDMYKDWPFFQVTIDLVEMVLAKLDPLIAEYYEKKLVAEELKELGGELRDLFHETKSLLLEVAGHDKLLTSPKTSILQERIMLRAPYMTPLNILQVIHLKNLRDYAADGSRGQNQSFKPSSDEVLQLLQLSGDQDRPPYLAAVEDAVTITMKGIASGMQNTG